jgi:hypothetical protein
MIGHADGTFFARLLVTGPVIAGEQLTRVDGRWLISDGLVITTIASHKLYLREHFVGCASEDHARPRDELLRRNSSCSSAPRKPSAKLFAPYSFSLTTASSQHSADPSGDLIEIPAGCSPLTGIEAEKIPHIAGEHVQMDVENLLTRSLAISEKQVHSLTPQTAAPNSCGQSLSNHEHPTTVGLVEVS